MSLHFDNGFERRDREFVLTARAAQRTITFRAGLIDVVEGLGLASDDLSSTEFGALLPEIRRAYEEVYNSFVHDAGDEVIKIPKAVFEQVRNRRTDE